MMKSDSQIIDEKLNSFKKICERSKYFPINISNSLVGSLRTSNLFKVAIKGVPSFRFDDTGVIQLVEAVIKSNIQLVDLSLPYHRITDAGLEEISRLFKQGSYSEELSTQLEGLDLEGNEITGSCFESCGLTSVYDCPLIFLNISCNPISIGGQNLIADIISKNKVLRQLSLNSCGLEMKSLINITSHLLENSTLQLLYIDRPILGINKNDEVVDHLSRVISKPSSALCDVSMKFFNILDHGAKLLSEALCTNENILSLNLECNNIGITGAEHIASYLLLKRKNSLQSLGLAFNRIGDDGAIAIAEVLRYSSSLRHLTLKQCGIGPVGLSAIAAALELAVPESRFESLSLFGNNFDDANGNQFYDLIQNRFPYTGIYIDIDVYIVDGKYMIAEN